MSAPAPLAEGPADGPALAPVAFWFLRHGQTDWNRDNLAQGRTDVPLNAEGLDQARRAAPLLDGAGIARIVCSPLVRAHVTARIVGAHLGVPVQVLPDLAEAEFGAEEGQPMLAQWFTDWIGGRFTPRGAESFAALGARAVGAVNAGQQAGPGPLLVVAHGALFRGLRRAMGLDPNVRLGNAIPLRCVPGRPWTLHPAA